MKLKPRYRILVLVVALGVLLYLSLVAARIIEYTGEYGASPNGALYGAAADGDTIAMQMLLALGADPHGTNPAAGFPPLSMAASQGQLRATRVLLKAGADPDAPYDMYTRPLSYAAIFGHREIADLLTEYGATYEVVDALFFGDEEFVRDAIENDGVDLKSIDYYRSSLLHAAVEYSNTDAARILLDAGLDPTDPAGRSESPLYRARIFQNDELIALFESYAGGQGDTSVNTKQESVEFP